MRPLLIMSLAALLSCAQPVQQAATPTHDDTRDNIYSWNTTYSTDNKLQNRIAPPAGYTRVSTAKKSFADWLRNLPLKPGKPDVLLYNGQKKDNQTAHYAVMDMDIGNKDLQQCADAVIRLRAEYLWSQKRYNEIHFNYTSGFNCEYTKWKEGYRPKVNGNDVQWEKTAQADDSYTNFKKYLESVFTYCGSKSLSLELKEVKDIHSIEAGQVFIRGGFPGHAVIVLDVAQNAAGEKVFLLGQSYMPAQEMHVLVNPNSSELSPWYSEKFFDLLATPEWNFYKTELKAW